MARFCAKRWCASGTRWRWSNSLLLTVSDQRVRIEVSDHVALVTLTRPDKHNALDVAMFEGILAAAGR